MRTVLSLLLFAVFSSTATNAQTPQVNRIEIVKFGIYDLKVVKNINAPGTAFGSIGETEAKFIQSTTTIPARLGISFGYEYKIIGRPANASVTLRDVNIVPEPGLRNQATGNIIFREEVQYAKRIGGTYRSDYTLRYDWTLLPGTWTFQLWLGDRKLAEQKFTLVKP